MTSPFTASMPSVRDDQKTWKRLEINHKRNVKQDHTSLIDEAAAAFRYEDCRDEYWNPEEYSLLYGSPLWDEASRSQRVLLNQLYWVAYYSQIISAEIATIFYNQTSAAGLYAQEDFRLVCDTLDLESAQERAHIAAFKSISEAVEYELFGERIFSYHMRGPFDETMIHTKASELRRRWKSLQLRSYGLLSAGNTFIACQYFTIRGMRTLNGKLVQHALSRYYSQHPDKESAPIPSKISYYHFQDESYHFNTSMLVAQDIVRSLKPPTRFEKAVCNAAIRGCQRDHYHFSSAIGGIFWYDPSVFRPVYRILRSDAFGMEHREALDMLERCFAHEHDGALRSRDIHRTAVDSYARFLEGMEFLSPSNREVSLMRKSDMRGHLRDNRRALARFGGE